jgi:adenine-specific DNA-methyltransferase
MARAAKPTTKDIESLRHREARRKHIPTTELESLVSEEERTPKVIRYKRNTDLDPQLVWRGKDEQDAEDLTIDAVPIYIQEKIKPEQIISDLKRRSEAIRRERAENEQYAIPDLYSDFNGLAEPVSEFDFYKHDKNWSNRMILGDSLLVMTSLAEKEALKGNVQCIYMDPPYGIRFNSNWQPSRKGREVKDGQGDSLTREPETIRAFRDTWKDGIHSYLAYLRDRLVIAQKLLNKRGSIFIQIGDENVHLVRTMMDEVFKPSNFVAQISFQKTGSLTGRVVSSICDYILWYAAHDITQLKFHKLYDLRTHGSNGDDPSADPLKSEGYRSGTTFDYVFRGQVFECKKNEHWKVTRQGLDRVGSADRLVPLRTSLRFKKYPTDNPGKEFSNIWQGMEDRQT